VLQPELLVHVPGVVRGTLDGRSNAYVGAMNGMLQQTKRAAHGLRTVKNCVAITYLRMSKSRSRIIRRSPPRRCDLPLAVLAVYFH
jgi:hypothetical protein